MSLQCIMTENQMVAHSHWGFPFRKVQPLVEEDVPPGLPPGEYCFITLQEAPDAVEATWQEWFEAEGIPSGEDR